jgi:peptidoglycan/xylan/chitin deacetylase (PgdA/CDA1 family)
MNPIRLLVPPLAACLLAGLVACSATPGRDGEAPAPRDDGGAQTARRVVDRAIEHHGGDLYTGSRVALTVTSASGSFDVVSEVDGERFRHTVTDPGADGGTRRVRVSNATGETVEEWRGGVPVDLDQDAARRARDFVMARVYFPFLPFRLNDPSVIHEDLGTERWGDRDLRKVRVTFEAGTSTDDQDVYLYWFDPDSGRLEQFAYSFETGDGGLRLRKGFHYRRVGGLLFFDSENWGVSGHGRDVLEITPAFADPETGEMEKISTVVLSDVEVTPVGDLSAAGAEKVMAVTVDDLPLTRMPDSAAEAERLTRRLVTTLTGHGVPAVGFVNEVKLEGDDGGPTAERLALLETWLDAGLELGNHTHSHPDLHRVPLAGWLEDLRRGERSIRALAAARDLPPPRWFRHPFLHTGRSAKDRRAVEAELAGRGFRVAPVTHDNQEYVYAAVYDRAHEAGDEELKARIAGAYVDYMLAQLGFVEGNARDLFGRAIPQVLLIHGNRLNADHLGRLLDAIEARGYRWASLGEAVADPAYDSADEYYGPAGITWLHRWALTRGAPKELYAGEPDVDPFVRELYEQGGAG